MQSQGLEDCTDSEEGYTYQNSTGQATLVGETREAEEAIASIKISPMKELDGGVVVAHHCREVKLYEGWIEIPWVDGGENTKPRYQAQCPFCHDRYYLKAGLV